MIGGQEFGYSAQALAKEVAGSTEYRRLARWMKALVKFRARKAWKRVARCIRKIRFAFAEVSNIIKHECALLTPGRKMDFVREMNRAAPHVRQYLGTWLNS